MYCESLRGFYSLQGEDFENAMITQVISRYENLNENDAWNDTVLAIFQYFFDVTFDEDVIFIYNNVMPIFAKILLDFSFSIKHKVPILLYMNNLLIHEKGFSNLLLSMDFFVYHEYFLSSFMQNFNLESFRFFRRHASKIKELTQKIKAKH